MGYTLRMQVQITEVYRDWIHALRDRTIRARIQVRVDRLVHGNPGQYRVLSDGVCELKIDVGPGYRVYYTRRGKTLIMLLIGGAKRTQKRDIKRALEMMKQLEG